MKASLSSDGQHDSAPKADLEPGFCMHLKAIAIKNRRVHAGGKEVTQPVSVSVASASILMVSASFPGLPGWDTSHVCRNISGTPSKSKSDCLRSYTCFVVVGFSIGCLTQALALTFSVRAQE